MFAETTEIMVSRPKDAGSDDLQNNLVALLKTPRSLKLALRWASSVWQTLHGEIYFDDLLVASSLRAAAPEAFDFLVRTADQIRGLSRKYRIFGASGRDKEAAAKVDALRNGFHEEYRSLARQGDRDLTIVMDLIAALFPQWKYNLDVDADPGDQRVRSTSPTDYWRRLLAEGADETPTDQEFFRALQPWQLDRSGCLPEMIQKDARWNEKMEQFSARLTDMEIYSLAEGVFRWSLDEAGPAANSDTSEGFIPLWRIAGHRAKVSKRFLTGEFKKAFRRSLRLALDIEYYWGSERNLGTDDSTRLRRFVELQCRKHLDSTLLCSVLDPSFPWTLHHLIRHMHLRSLVSHTDWSPFVPTLFDAADRCPEIVVPQIAILISVHRDTRPGAEAPRRIDDDFVATMFKSDDERLRLFRVLSAAPEKARVTGEAAVEIARIRQEAIARLATNEQAPKNSASLNRSNTNGVGDS